MRSPNYESAIVAGGLMYGKSFDRYFRRDAFAATYGCWYAHSMLIVCNIASWALLYDWTSQSIEDTILSYTYMYTYKEDAINLRNPIDRTGEDRNIVAVVFYEPARIGAFVCYAPKKASHRVIGVAIRFCRKVIISVRTSLGEIPFYSISVEEIEWLGKGDAAAIFTLTDGLWGDIGNMPRELRFDGNTSRKAEGV